jgi:hypothetical protein
MVDIHFIYANKCEECKSMNQLLNALIRYHDLGDDVNLLRYDCESEEAIDIALEYEINDIPGCHIDGTVIEGEGFNRHEVESAMENLANTLKNA